MKITDIKAGDQVLADASFTCVQDYNPVTIEEDEDGELFFLCCEGRHYLISDDDLIGLSPYPTE
jgi:hypothetical protein